MPSERRARLLLILVLVVPVLGAAGLREYRDRETRALQPELVAALGAETAAFEKIVWDRPPAFGTAVPGTAWEHYRRAWALADEAEENAWCDDEVRDVWEAHCWSDGWPEPPPEGFEALHPRFFPAFEALVEGARTSTTGPASNLRCGLGASSHDSPDWPAPHEVVCTLQRLVFAIAPTIIESGEEDQGLDLLIALDRLGEDTLRGASLIDALVGASHRLKVARVLSSLVAGESLTPAGVERVREWLERSEVCPASYETLVTGSWLAEQWDYHRAATGHDELLTVIMAGARGNPQYYELRAPLEFIRCWQWLRETERELRSEVPDRTVADAPRMDLAFRDLAARRPFPHSFFAEYHRGTYQMLPTVLGHLALARWTVLLNLSLRSFREENGLDPEDISEILPPGVPATTLRGPWTYQRYGEDGPTWLEPGERKPRSIWAEELLLAILKALD
jgi:hypothetical protein